MTGEHGTHPGTSIEQPLDEPRAVPLERVGGSVHPENRIGAHALLRPDRIERMRVEALRDAARFRRGVEDVAARRRTRRIVFESAPQVRVAPVAPWPDRRYVNS